MVIGSYFVRPGVLCGLLGSPPSRCSMSSVVRLSAVTLLTPATYAVPHLMRNLKFLYGSNRVGFVVNLAIAWISWMRSGLQLARQLLDADDHELGRLERREGHEDVHTTEIDVGLRGRLLVAL